MSQKSAGDAGLDWSSLGFVPQSVNGHVKCLWSDGTGWSQPEFVTEATVTLPVYANVLHYGQSVFEGQKVFHGKDGKARVFRDKSNHERMATGCCRLMLPCPSLETFHAAIDLAVKNNIEFLPPYGSGCSFYVRPIVFGSSNQIMLHPATEAMFLVMVTPVGGYYKGGAPAPVPAMVVEQYDRAAPRGVGYCKAAGNYAADMKAAADGKHQGFTIGLYLDPKERRYVEEFNTSNFVAIVGNKYLTPESPSILPSITNKSLAALAEDLGLQVERRPVDFLKEVETFDEVGAVGTAVVVTPIKSITHEGKTWEFKAPDVLQRLYNKMRSVQVGEEEDTHGFMREIPLS
mmetsp:Transcript_52601/g.122438  ORF Transcript_52601/g.122438 Transcript_52601/m.122438 type:complete len:346 (-) Transcript_52601:103-1140(-)